MKLKNLPLSKENCLIVCITAIVSILAFISELLIGHAFTQTLVYQRYLIAEGELWRLFTGHILHTNGYHLLLNLLGLLMLWVLHGRFYSIKIYSALLLFCAITTSLGLYFIDTTLIQYVGLSGILHGVFIFGALMDINADDKTGYLLFLGLWLKIAHEQFYGASNEVSSLIEASVAIDAHLWGAFGGLLFSVIYLNVELIKLRRQYKKIHGKIP